MKARSLAAAIGLAAALLPPLHAVGAEADSPLQADPAAGKQAFLAKGCAQCHGPAGEGTEDAPRLASLSLPLPDFISRVRRPANRMPVFSRGMVSDPDLASIRAYLKITP